MKEITKRNIFLKETKESLPYTSKPSRGSKKIPSRDVIKHSEFLSRKFQGIYMESLLQKKNAAFRYKDGTYLEFSSAKGHDLAIKSLENLKLGIRLLNVRTEEEENIVHATIYVPDGKESYFIKKVETYLSSFIERNKARNSNLINSIEDVKLAFLDAFWIGTKNSIPTQIPQWCEIWLRADDNDYDTIESCFVESCKELHIQYQQDFIKFPERLVKLAFVNENQIANLLCSSSIIAEIRRAPELTSFFDDLSVQEQTEWVEDLLSRIDYSPSNTTICILDTGINHGHPLLKFAIADETVQSINPSWGTNDHDGHGTGMAGVALYNNIKDLLTSSTNHQIYHTIESVKILPPKGENDPALYGAITKQAVYLAEIENPLSNRVICLAVTSNKYTTDDGSPTSWSGSIDAIASEDAIKKGRLFFISAGNIHPNEIKKTMKYPDTSVLHSVESPGQAWNAITVGAYANLIQNSDKSYSDYHPIANVGELSPYSSTSMMWNHKWPIKPEILCDGGNMATDDSYPTDFTDFSLLTTYFRPYSRLFTTTWGTSPATAQASNIAAQLMEAYPHAWPETIRALIIHSARWTEAMKRQFCSHDIKTKGRQALLRTCGYGIPNLDTAIQCLENSVNLVIQGELQPFGKKSMKEMHIHKIPWPEQILRDLGEVQAEMRVTLSYFIEPGPGDIGWKDRYRYPSCSLRFDVINNNETKEDFIKRIDVKMRGEDIKDSGEGTSGSEHWYLGSANRDVGSIHSDFRQQNAVDLCEANYIAIYPVIGWWRERTNLHCYNKKIRYSLVVSISTPAVKTDLYTPIVTQIEIPTAQTIQV